MHKLRPVNYPICFCIVFCFVLFSCKSAEDKSDTKVAENVMAPDFELMTLNGEKRSLADYKGKTVLLNFWATWCPPCLAELPSLSEIAKKYKEQGLKVVAISCDSPDELEKIKKMNQENGYEFEILLDPQISVPNKYGVTGFPESFFIGHKGQYLDFNDPESKQKVQRIISEREWDSAAVEKSIEEILN